VVKNAKKCDFCPALVSKNEKSGGFLRVCGEKMADGAVFFTFFLWGGLIL